MMKKIIFSFVSILMVAASPAQTIGNDAFPQLKGGILDFNLSKDSTADGNQIRFGGFFDATAYYTDAKNADTERGFDITHADLSVEGRFLKGKLGFFLQADFATSDPLLDALVSYMPVRGLRITAGQKQSFTNTRQMMMLDQGQAFNERSFVSRSFFKSGRELGLFLEGRLPIKKTGLDIGVSVTSGDGRNSFGSSSTDPDCGGLKYGGRVSFYPFGFFSPGNELVFNDFARETTPKLAIGGAFSYNDGASSPVGEGHGEFTMYDEKGEVRYPDYRVITADVLFKWQGFSLLADYVNTTAASLDRLYLDPNGGTKLQPKQISDYLALGNGFDVQAGYLFPKMWAVDVAYSMVRPEWEETSSVLQRAENIEAGVSKYFAGNSVKIQLATEYTRYTRKMTDDDKSFTVRFNLQLVF